jgi:hypothetical protein
MANYSLALTLPTKHDLPITKSCMACLDRARRKGNRWNSQNHMSVLREA